MTHLCKNCVYCKKLLKVGFKYNTYCEKEFCEQPITKKVKYCNYHEKKYLTFEEVLNMYDIQIITITKKEN